MPWVVVDVEASSDTTIEVGFVDGTRGRVDMTAILRGKAGIGPFEKLRDPVEFRRVVVDDGDVTWPCGVDLAPDAMHAAIEKTGCWVLR